MTNQQKLKYEMLAVESGFAFEILFTIFWGFNVTYAVTSVQAIAAGLVGLADRSARPVFPRWVSYWAIFAGISFVPLTAMPFFKTGPLAWNGAISFWTLFGTYFFWTASMGICMVKDALRRLRDERELDISRPQKLVGASA